jgi:hypothetical protein
VETPEPTTVQLIFSKISQDMMHHVYTVQIMETIYATEDNYQQP